MTKRYDLSTDNTLGGSNASHNIASSQKAIKEYIDNNSSSIPLFIVRFLKDNDVYTCVDESYSPVTIATIMQKLADNYEVRGQYVDMTNPSIVGIEFVCSHGEGDFQNFNTNGNKVTFTSDSNGEKLVAFKGEIVSGSDVWTREDIQNKISNLADTVISSPSDGQILKYDASTQKWYNGAPPNKVYTITQTNGSYVCDTSIADIFANGLDNAWLRLERIPGVAYQYYTIDESMSYGDMFSLMGSLFGYSGSSYLINTVVKGTTTTTDGITTDSWEVELQSNTIPTIKGSSDGTYWTSLSVNLNNFKIPAAQVNSDWNATSGVAQILNKPSLATVATSGSYSDLNNKPTIPTVNNGTVTLKQGGVTKGSFSLNQAGSTTINLDSSEIINISSLIFDHTQDGPYDEPAYGSIWFDFQDGNFYEWNGYFSLSTAYTAKDGMILYCALEDAFYIYHSQSSQIISSISKGRTSYVIHNDIDGDGTRSDILITLPLCDTITSIILDSSNYTQSSANYLSFIGSWNDGTENAPIPGNIGSTHTIFLRNNLDTDIIFSFNSFFDGTYYLLLGKGFDDYGSFTIPAGKCVEISVMLYDVYGDGKGWPCFIVSNDYVMHESGTI